MLQLKFLKVPVARFRDIAWANMTNLTWRLMKKWKKTKFNKKQLNEFPLFFKKIGGNLNIYVLYKFACNSGARFVKKKPRKEPKNRNGSVAMGARFYLFNIKYLLFI